MGKLGFVSHHLLDATGNEGVEQAFVEIHNMPGYQELRSYAKDYYSQSVSEGWPYINIAQTDATRQMHVNFFADNTTAVRSYFWDFGDSVTAKTINNEVTHTYDLSTRATWMDQTGALPIRGLESYNGRWTDVTLKATSLSGTVSDTTNHAFVYEIIPDTQEGPWQAIDEIPNAGHAETIQATISTGDVVQTVDF
jgi:hypothetical protein